MKNDTAIKVPKKYEAVLAIVEEDPDGYWAYTVPGHYFVDAGPDCHTAHESSQRELLTVIRSVASCDCPRCTS